MRIEKYKKKQNVGKYINNFTIKRAKSPKE